MMLMDPECVLGTLGTRQEHNLDKLSPSQGNTHTHTDTEEQFSTTSPHTNMLITDNIHQ